MKPTHHITWSLPVIQAKAFYPIQYNIKTAMTQENRWINNWLQQKISLYTLKKNGDMSKINTLIQEQKRCNQITSVSKSRKRNYKPITSHDKISRAFSDHKQPVSVILNQGRNKGKLPTLGPYHSDGTWFLSHWSKLQLHPCSQETRVQYSAMKKKLGGNHKHRLESKENLLKLISKKNKLQSKKYIEVHMNKITDEINVANSLAESWNNKIWNQLKELKNM